MKHVKKLICLLSVLALVVGIIPFAFAQEVPVGEGAGSITVTNATIGKEYSLFKLFDATYNEDGGVAYTYTKSADDALFELLNSEDSPFVMEQVLDSDVYNVTVKEGTTGSAISEWVKANLLEEQTQEDGSKVLVPKDILAPIATETAMEEELKFSGLPFGYYFLTSTLGATITLTSNTPDQNVIDKNSGPSWDVDDNGSGKVITSDSNKDYVVRDEEGNIIVPGTNENSVNVGDTVDFLIGVNTTNYNGDKPITEYRIYDSLAPGFEYDKESFEVKIGDKVLTKVDSFEEAVVGENYTITWSEDDQDFVIRVPWYVAPQNEEAEAVFASATPTNVLSVSYSATLEAVFNAEDGSDETIYAGDSNKNTARYDFLDTSDTPDEPDPENPQPHHEVDEKVTKTYTFALGLVKVDGETKDRLKGAEFQVRYTEGEGEEAVTYYLIAEELEDGSYLYTGRTEDPEQATTFKTDDQGQLIIRGLAEGSYEIIETKAPDGYNKLADSIVLEAQIATAHEQKTSYTYYYDEEGNLVETEVEEGTTLTVEYPVNVLERVVENNKGTTFPETGGVGTKLFYIIGGALVLLAVVLIVVRKRMRNFE